MEKTAFFPEEVEISMGAAVLAQCLPQVPLQMLTGPQADPV